MRVAFLGSGAFGLPTLERLAERHNVVAVITQPDRPAGRGQSLQPTPVGAWCRGPVGRRALGDAPVLKPENINDPATLERVRALVGPPRCDALVVIAFGQKLGEPLLEGLFAINLHASLLPRWRGAAPINWAILAGDTETGNSVISIASRMDAGLIYATSRQPIHPQTTAGDLHELLARDGPDLVLRVLDDHAHGRARGVPQDETQVTKARKLSRADAIVDFARSAEEIRRQVNGLSPWPGVGVAVDARSRLRTIKLLRAVTADGRADTGGTRTAAPGALLDPGAGLVCCGQGSVLRVLEVQVSGGRPVSWQEFARGIGRDLAAGDRLVSVQPT
jgi:methionyl-tRNA formyltransferase